MRKRKDMKVLKIDAVPETSQNSYRDIYKSILSGKKGDCFHSPCSIDKVMSNSVAVYCWSKRHNIKLKIIRRYVDPIGVFIEILEKRNDKSR